MIDFVPVYLKTDRTYLAEKSCKLTEKLKSCDLCGHCCHVDRTRGDTGICGAADTVYISSYGPHRGEEPFFSGEAGAGAVFFAFCNSACVFCQNYQISQENKGYPVSTGELADIFLSLQQQGCHNLDLVTPTHFTPQIVRALLVAIDNGLHIPILYNTNAFDNVDMLRLLDGIVDIYLPDLKYSDNEKAVKYSALPRYVEWSRAAVVEMFRQVGLLNITDDNVACKGIAIRHLCMPGDAAGSPATLEWLFSLSGDIQLCLMSQYSPLFLAGRIPEINRIITPTEYAFILEYAERLGFENILAQELDSADVYIPDFSQDEPFASSL